MRRTASGGTRGLVSVLVALFVLISPSTAPTATTVYRISAPNRTDMAYGTEQKILYITSGGSVLRYNLATKKFLSALILGGDLNGLDLSADGKTLAVADASLMSLILINLSTLKVTELPITPGQDEVGLYDVAWGADKMVYMSAALPPGKSGWVAPRKIDPATGHVLTVGSETVTNETVLRASPDRTVIGFAQGAIADGRWGSIDTKSGVVTMRDAGNGTGYYKKDIAVARKAHSSPSPLSAVTQYSTNHLPRSDF